MTMAAGWARLCGATLMSVCCAGCGDRLDAPSAYAEQSFLCGDDAEAERSARTLACQADEQCAGWMSFRGTLQGQAVTVSASLEGLRVKDENVLGAGRVRKDLTLLARAPYFELRWALSDFYSAAASSPEREWRIGGKREDGAMGFSQRLAGGGASVDFTARAGYVQSAWTNSEQWGALGAEFGNSNVVDGCFFARLPGVSGQ
jgi:hypothetical protein